MSYDLHIAHACPHHIRYERVGITNGRLVSPRSPIGGVGLLEIRRDGVLLNKEGNLREAFTVAPQSSPYRIRQGKNVLGIRTSNGDDYQITIPSKIYQAEALATYLKPKLKDVIVSLERKSLKFSDNLVGFNFTLYGSVLKSLGYAKEKEVVKSKRITPPWSLVKRLNGYDVLFSKDLSPEGLLDISYTTLKEFCRRCNSTGVENDIRWNDQGEMGILGGTDLLYQNVAKSILTEIGSNPYHSFYGSNALSLIGRKVNSGTAMSLRESVNSSLNKLISVQRLQRESQDLSAEEKILGVESITVSQIDNDQTSLLCNVVVRSGAGQPVSVNVIFSVPGSTSLNGDL
jgi:phage baseplate assembly protein W